MDNRTSYSRIKKMLEDHPYNEITLTELRSLIMVNIGSNAITIKNALIIIRETGLLKDIGNKFVKVNGN